MDHTSRWSGHVRVALWVVVLCSAAPTAAEAQFPRNVTAQIDTQGNLQITGTLSSDSITVTGGPQVTIFVGAQVLPPRALGRIGNGAIRTVTIITGPGNDFVNCSGCRLPCVIKGGVGNDTLIGGMNKDQIFGEVGDDVITGNAGNDFLIGGPGKDTINGGDGDDLLDGGDGDDTLIGGPGYDTVIGGSGADRFTLGTQETLRTPASYDRIRDFGRGLDVRTDASNVGWATIPIF